MAQIEGFDEPPFRKVLGKLKGCKGRMFQTNCLIEHWLTNMEIELFGNKGKKIIYKTNGIQF